MAVEVEVHCRERPHRLEVCRLTGWVMRTVLDAKDVAVSISQSDETVWHARWGTSVSAQVVELAHGPYDFPDRWVVTVAPGERGIDLSKLFAVVLADATAVLCDGYLRDEGDLIGHGEHPAGHPLARLLTHPPSSESAALSAIRPQI